jgi:hypothetical protein
MLPELRRLAPVVCEFMCVASAYRRMSCLCFVFVCQGAIEVYQRQYIYAKTDNFTHVRFATLFLTNPQTSDRLGTSVSISTFFIGAGGPSRFTDTQSDAVRAGRHTRFPLLNPAHRSSSCGWIAAGHGSCLGL